jgi:hypothetical protein
MSDETVEETTAVEVETASEPDLVAAFVVAIGKDSRVYLERNTEATTLKVEREASLIEVRRYLSEILMDLQAQAAGEYTITALMAAQSGNAPQEEN